MPTVTFIALDGKAHSVEVPDGTTLMRAATDYGVAGIDGDCGGNCACATCHVLSARIGRTGGQPGAAHLVSLKPKQGSKTRLCSDCDRWPSPRLLGLFSSGSRWP